MGFASQKFSDKLNTMRNESSNQFTDYTGVGLNAFINRVYKASGAGIMTALGSS